MRRNLGKIRLLGLIPLGLSLFFPAFVVMFTRGIFNAQGGPAWLPILGPLLMGSLVLTAEWKFWRIGLAILIGRSEVRIEADTIIAVERLPFRLWTRTLPMASVQRIQLAGPGESSRVGKNGRPSPTRDLFGITLYENKQKWPLVIGYPLAMLQPLAAQVAQHVNAGRDKPVPVELFRGTLDEQLEANQANSTDTAEEPGASAWQPSPVPEQPGGSTAVVTENHGELSIELPPAGLRKGSKGLFPLAVFWNLFMLAMLIGFAIVALGQGGMPIGTMLVAGTVFVLFEAIGVWLMVSAISMGKRLTIIDVVGDSLLISTTTPFKTSERTFLAGDLESVKAGPSGTEINDVPVLELQIRHHAINEEAGKQSDGVSKVGMLSSRPDVELKWLAALLCDRLGLNQPANSPVRMRLRNDADDRPASAAS